MITARSFLILWFLFLINILFFGFQALAVDAPKKNTQTTKVQKIKKKAPLKSRPQVVESEKSVTEDMQKDVSKRVVSLANRLDSLFGEKRSYDEKNGSTLRLIPSYRVSEYATPVAELEINLNLKLLNLEREGRELEERIFSPQGEPAPEDTLDLIEDPKYKNNEYEREQERLRIEQEQWGWNYNVESRVVVKAPLGFFSKLRARKNFRGDKFTHRFYNEFGWDSTSYWQELASFSSDKELTRKLLFRFNNELNWYFYTNAISSSHGPSLIQSLSPKDSISYDLRANGVIERFVWTLDSYGPSVVYRRQLERKWIFYELNPAITFSRLNNFKRELSFFMRVEFVFGDY